MYTINDDKLATLHDALKEASLVPQRESGGMATSSYKVPKDVLDKAGEIISANGATVSAYLRKCLELLVADYTG